MTRVMQTWEKLPEKTRAEVIDNQLYVSPNANTRHFFIQDALYEQLKQHVKVNELGTMFHSVDLFLEDNTQVVEPDIYFISKRNKWSIEFRGVFGAPDLVIEILSPGNSNHDLIRKKNLYERNGVREYWIVDPETREAQGYLLKKGAYGHPRIMTSKIYVRIFNKEISF
jgi:Uma2 family endonuclease